MAHMRGTMIASSILAGMLLTAGCSTGEKDKMEQTQTTLKVMYYDTNGFNARYGMAFAMQYPNIDVEVITTQNVKYKEGEDPDKTMLDYIAEKKPDVLMLNGSQYEKLAGEGKLLDLEALAARDKFDVEGIIPGLVDYIKDHSDGKLYGLASEFYSQAVYYNKDLFEKYGIPEPLDRMSWKELLQLAARFPTEGTDRIYGLRTNYGTDLMELGMMIGIRQGLSFVDPTTRTMTMQSEAWKEAFDTAYDAVKSGSLYEEAQGTSSWETMEDYLFSNPLISGKTAMMMDGQYLASQIKQAQAMNPDKAVRDWDVVTVPVNPGEPGTSLDMSVSQIFAIDAGSTNKEAAWEFIRYANSEEYAKALSKAWMGDLPVRSKYIVDPEGHNLSAFYSLKPVDSNAYAARDKLPAHFYENFRQNMQKEFDAVAAGELSVSEALANLQTSGQQLLAAK